MILPSSLGLKEQKPTVCPGRFALKEVAEGLHSNALFTANCKARQGCHKHLREQYSEYLQPPWELVPVLNHPWEEGQLLSYTLAKPMMILVLVILWNQKTEVYG